MKDQITLIQSRSQQIPIVFSRRQAPVVISLNFVQTQAANVAFLISRLACAARRTESSSYEPSSPTTDAPGSCDAVGCFRRGLS